MAHPVPRLATPAKSVSSHAVPAATGEPERIGGNTTLRNELAALSPGLRQTMRAREQLAETSTGTAAIFGRLTTMLGRLFDDERPEKPRIEPYLGRRS